MEPLSTVWAVSSKIYTSNSLSKEIAHIYSSISAVYADVANAHFESAKKAIEAASCSNRSDIEIRDAISHLRDAYNVYKALLKKTIKKRFLLLFSYDEDLIRDKMNFYQQVSRIAAVISIIYRGLDEQENAETWRESAIADFEIFLDAYDPSVDELKKINSNYVESVEKTTTRIVWNGDGMPSNEIETSYYTEEVSHEGRSYVNSKKASWKRDFMDSLFSRRFEINLKQGSCGNS